MQKNVRQTAYQTSSGQFPVASIQLTALPTSAPLLLLLLFLILIHFCHPHLPSISISHLFRSWTMFGSGRPDPKRFKMEMKSPKRPKVPGREVTTKGREIPQQHQLPLQPPPLTRPTQPPPTDPNACVAYPNGSDGFSSP